MSAFLYFSQDRRRQLKAENPELRNTEISRMLGKLWREAPEEVRAPHIAKEKEERERYKVRIEKWRNEHDERMEEQRKIQAEQAAHAAAVFGQSGGQEAIQSSEQPQYNYANAPGAPPGYDQGFMAQQQQFMGQQQMYGYPQAPYPGYGAMPCKFVGCLSFFACRIVFDERLIFDCSRFFTDGYNVPQGQFNVRQAVVLGPNGMPHYQSQYGGGQQVDQGQGYEGGAQQQPQVSYDYGDQAGTKSEE